MAETVTSAAPLPPLRGLWLVAARVGWMTLAIVALGSFVRQVPNYFAPKNAPSPSILAGLPAIGWNASTYITFEVVRDCLFVAVFSAMGWLIFLRKSADRVALLVALFLVAYGPGNGSLVQPPQPASPGVAILILSGIGGLSVYVPLMLFFYLFPSGRFVPRWTRWFALAWVVFAAGFPVWETHLPPVLFEAVVISLWGSFLVAQAYRYLRVSSPSQRLRTKWVLYGIAAAVAGNLANLLLAPSTSNGLGTEVLRSPQQDAFGFTLPPLLQGMGGVITMSVVTDLLVLLIPVTLAISILRHQLFDIDVIINRTLVYGSLTAALGAIYFGSVVILQALLRAVTGSTPSVVLVVSTLLIAVLFQPLRSRLQSGIDRRFYREKYDAAKVVDQFSAGLQQNVQLDEVTASLLHAVEQTMHPSQMSLWIRVPEHTADHS